MADKDRNKADNRGGTPLYTAARNMLEQLVVRDKATSYGYMAIRCAEQRLSSGTVIIIWSSDYELE